MPEAYVRHLHSRCPAIAGDADVGLGCDRTLNDVLDLLVQPFNAPSDCGSMRRLVVRRNFVDETPKVDIIDNVKRLASQAYKLC